MSEERGGGGGGWRHGRQWVPPVGGGSAADHGDGSSGVVWPIVVRCQGRSPGCGPAGRDGSGEAAVLPGAGPWARTTSRRARRGDGGGALVPAGGQRRAAGPRGHR